MSKTFLRFHFKTGNRIEKEKQKQEKTKIFWNLLLSSINQTVWTSTGYKLNFLKIHTFSSVLIGRGPLMTIILNIIIYCVYDSPVQTCRGMCSRGCYGLCLSKLNSALFWDASIEIVLQTFQDMSSWGFLSEITIYFNFIYLFYLFFSGRLSGNIVSAGDENKLFLGN